MTSELAALTAFTVTVGYHLRETVVEVYPPRERQPSARLVKVGPRRARAAYQLSTGPDLTRPAGQVSPSGALDTDGTPVGIVNLSGGRLADADIHPMSGARQSYVVRNPARWYIAQPGLPRLAGHAVGRATRLCFNRLTDLGEKTGIDVPTPDFLLTLTFGYEAPGSAGFTVVRPARRSRYEITVHDSRLDRRLILACLTAVTALV